MYGSQKFTDVMKWFEFLSMISARIAIREKAINHAGKMRRDRYSQNLVPHTYFCIYAASIGIFMSELVAVAVALEHRRLLGQPCAASSSIYISAWALLEPNVLSFVE